MLIRLTAEGASIAEATDLGRLSVAANAGEDIATALGALGRPDGADHVWLDVIALEAAAAAGLPRGVDVVAWRAGYASMVTYADEKGWLDADRSHLRAHVTPAD